MGSISMKSLMPIFAGPKQLSILLLSFAILLMLKFLFGILLNGYTEKYHNVTYSMSGTPISRNVINAPISPSQQVYGPFEQQKRKKPGDAAGNKTPGSNNEKGTRENGEKDKSSTVLGNCS